jgi:hypothetical protein
LIVEESPQKRAHRVPSGIAWSIGYDRVVARILKT